MNDEGYFWHADKLWSFLQVWSSTLKFIILGGHSQACPKSQNYKLCYFLAISQRTEWWSWFFCMQANMNVSYKLLLWFLMGMVKHSQSAQNSKLAMSLQYLKENMKDEVDLSAGKHQRFLQIEIIILGASESRHAQITQSFLFICNTLRKNEWWSSFFAYIFSFLFLVLIFWTVRGVKGQK